LRELVLEVRGADVASRYHRPFLAHADWMVVSTQHKAWMDSVGMCMWVDLVMGPWAKASGRKKILVWDSCGPHKVAAVKAVFDEWCVCSRACAYAWGVQSSSAECLGAPMCKPFAVRFCCSTAEQRMTTFSDRVLPHHRLSAAGASPSRPSPST